jgi:hypothetical protein
MQLLNCQRHRTTATVIYDNTFRPLLYCLIAEDARQRIQQLSCAAAAKGVQRPALMAAAVASMTPGSADEDMSEHDKLLVSYMLLGMVARLQHGSVRVSSSSSRHNGPAKVARNREARPV